MRWGMSQATWWADLVIMTLLDSGSKICSFCAMSSDILVANSQILAMSAKNCLLLSNATYFTLCNQRLLRVRPGAFPLVANKPVTFSVNNC